MQGDGIMKISETQHGQIAGTGTQKNRTPAGEEGRFQEIMEQAVQKEAAGGSGVRKPAGVPIPDGVQIIPGLERVQSVQAEGARDRLLSDIRETLDLVDHYARALGNPSLSPEEMRPLVEHLEGRIDGLRQMEADPAVPGKLRDVVSDLAITLGTEVAKFGRGDYE